MDRVYIFDTTLRDGEQAPGCSMNVEQKLDVANALKRLNVDVIEAGFPIASKGDFEAVSKIAKEVGSSYGPIIAGLSRAIRQDIEVCYEALKSAKRYRIHTFIATSKIHMKYKLKMTEDEVLETAVRAVKLARNLSDDVEFSTEDAVRSEPKFLYKVIEAAIKAGANVINIPDTVGYGIPRKFGELISNIINNVSNIDKAILSVHCHNDLGLAVANSLEAVLSGARQVHCTINGLGERGGNAALEEVVMAIKIRKDIFKCYTNVKTTEIYRTSKLVSTYVGFSVQPNKAIVGANAFAHESGIHQDGVLKYKGTYEIMTPKMVGVPESQIVLGKHSGRHALKKRLLEYGINLSEAELNEVFKKFKDLADKKKYLVDEDILALVKKDIAGFISLEYLIVNAGYGVLPSATVRLKINEKILQESMTGDGPVDAVYKAINKILNMDIKLEEYSLRALSTGCDAQGEVTVRIEYRGNTYKGVGVSTDIVDASARAYLDAINKIFSKIEKRRILDKV
ncbi:MAG: 2-isopropylmalate synthase [bacterium]|nr:2-isopropylmalate synthase [bacterium]